jgi:hypothetical protein
MINKGEKTTTLAGHTKQQAPQSQQNKIKSTLAHY